MSSSEKMSSFISIDGTITNIGLVMGTFGPTGVVVPQNGLLVKTEPTKNSKIPKSEDYLNRCHHLYRVVNNLVNSIKPDYIFIEGPTGSKSQDTAI